MQKDITGRDDEVIAMALAYASEFLATMAYQVNDEPSNREDMDKLLAHLVSPEIEAYHRQNARAKIMADNGAWMDTWLDLID